MPSPPGVPRRRTVLTNLTLPVLAGWGFLLGLTYFFGIGVVGSRDRNFPSIFLNLPAEMIRMYPHIGYGLLWLLGGIQSTYGEIIWDLVNVVVWIVTIPFTLAVAIGLYYRKLWACYLAAATALLAAVGQFHSVHFLHNNWFTYGGYKDILRHAMSTGILEEKLASLVSAVVGITLLRVAFFSPPTNEQSSNPSIEDKRRLHRVMQFLFWTLVAWAFMLLTLAGNTISKENSASQGADRGFSVIFVLLMLIPVGTTAAGVAATINRFFLGLTIGSSVFFSVVLYVSWYNELDGPHSPIGAIKPPVWANLVVCIAIVATASLALYLTRNRPPRERGLGSLGFAVGTAFVVAALSACRIHYAGFSLLRY